MFGVTDESVANVEVMFSYVNASLRSLLAVCLYPISYSRHLFLETTKVIRPNIYHNHNVSLNLNLSMALIIFLSMNDSIKKTHYFHLL